MSAKYAKQHALRPLAKAGVVYVRPIGRGMVWIDSVDDDEWPDGYYAATLMLMPLTPEQAQDAERRWRASTNATQDGLGLSDG